MLYKFNTVKQHDNSRLLEVSFVANNKKDRKIKLPVYGADINFINIVNEEEFLLGTVKTDKDGFARLTLPENQTYYTDADGYINFIARFENTEAMGKTSAGKTAFRINPALAVSDWVPSIREVATQVHGNRPVIRKRT